jgi:hypothetical protein
MRGARPRLHATQTHRGPHERDAGRRAGLRNEGALATPATALGSSRSGARHQVLAQGRERRVRYAELARRMRRIALVGLQHLGAQRKASLPLGPGRGFVVELKGGVEDRVLGRMVGPPSRSAHARSTTPRSSRTFSGQMWVSSSASAGPLQVMPGPMACERCSQFGHIGEARAERRPLEAEHAEPRVPIAPKGVLGAVLGEIFMRDADDAHVDPLGLAAPAPRAPAPCPACEASRAPAPWDHSRPCARRAPTALPQFSSSSCVPPGVNGRG